MDVKHIVDYCTEYQLEHMFRRFYPDEPEHRAIEFARRLKEITPNVSPAQVQGYFMFYKDDPQGVMDNVQDVANL